MKAGRCAPLALTIAAMGAGLAQADDTGPALKAGHEYMIVTNYPNNLHVVMWPVTRSTRAAGCRTSSALAPQ